MRYVAEQAGNLELHVWAVDKPGGQQFLEVEGERIALPGSPFLLHCAAGKANPSGSSVQGFTRIKEVEEPRAGMKASGNGLRGTLQPRRNREREAICSYDDSTDMFAGDALSVRPKIRDKLGNPTAAPDGDLRIELSGPGGLKQELTPSIAVKSGLTSYDVRYEPQTAGPYQMAVYLAGSPIEGSPVMFECVASLPDVYKSTYTLPVDADGKSVERLYANTPYEITVRSVDRCGNPLDHGGATVTGRLQSANLPAQQEPVLEVIDCDDGTYRVQIQLRAPCELKVLLSIDKELHPRGGEMAPFPLVFVAAEGSGNARMKKAAEHVKKEMPEREKKERSAQELTQLAVEEFAKGGRDRAANREVATASRDEASRDGAEGAPGAADGAEALEAGPDAAKMAARRFAAGFGAKSSTAAAVGAPVPAATSAGSSTPKGGGGGGSTPKGGGGGSSTPKGGGGGTPGKGRRASSAGVAGHRGSISAAASAAPPAAAAAPSVAAPAVAAPAVAAAAVAAAAVATAATPPGTARKPSFNVGKR